MGLTSGNLLDGKDWISMEGMDAGESPTYLWADGGLLRDAPVDFSATFNDNLLMCLTTKPIRFESFNRNPLKGVPNFVVPRHYHNMDEMILVLEGEYHIEHGDGDEREVTVVKAGECFLSRAETPYKMTAGPEGVVYIETWPRPVEELLTTWSDEGWVHR